MFQCERQTLGLVNRSRCHRCRRIPVAQHYLRVRTRIPVGVAIVRSIGVSHGSVFERIWKLREYTSEGRVQSVKVRFGKAVCSICSSHWRKRQYACHSYVTASCQWWC